MSNCEKPFDGETVCEDIFNCCDCGTDDQENGCGCRYCWACNVCDNCKDEEE